MDRGTHGNPRDGGNNGVAKESVLIEKLTIKSLETSGNYPFSAGNWKHC